VRFGVELHYSLKPKYTLSIVPPDFLVLPCQRKIAVLIIFCSFRRITRLIQVFSSLTLQKRDRSYNND
jgi:hypothetical protein